MTMKQKLAALLADRKASAIASQAGVTSQTLSGYRTGKYVPGADVAFRLALALGVDLTWLMDEAQAWPPVPAKNPYFPPAPETAKAA
jgi:transcriptional regulator with XRE-family HTH domain